jgi:alpha-tubulin suppressor-like RCC1 family protein
VQGTNFAPSHLLAFSIAKQFSLRMLAGLLQTGRCLSLCNVRHGLAYRRLLHAWGNADACQLGVALRPGDEELDTYGRSVRTPRPVSTIPLVADVCTGGAHSVFVCSDDGGSVFSCGLNDRGQLGRATTESELPERVSGLPPIVAAATGGNHTILLDRDGLIYSFGCNARGQLGRDDGADLLVRSLVDAGKRIVSVAAGLDFSVALCDSGDVLSWGASDNGRLGHGRPTGTWITRLAQKRTSDDERRPRKVAALDGQRVAKVFAGSHSAGVLLLNGDFAAFGSGRNFVLGNGNDEDSWEPELVTSASTHSRGVKMALGMQHTLLLFDDGSVHGCGSGEHGALGVDDEQTVSEVRQIALPSCVSTVDVAAGWGVSMAVLKNGELFAWGSGAAGALGDGYETADRWQPQGVSIDGCKIGQVRMSPTGRHVFAW